MPSLKSFATATEKQKERYIEANRHARRGVTEALLLLDIRRLLYADFDEAAFIDVELADLEAKRAKLRAEFIQFKANALTIKPPSSQAIKRLANLAREIGELTASAVTAVAILELATGVVERFAKTQE